MGDWLANGRKDKDKEEDTPQRATPPPPPDPSASFLRSTSPTLRRARKGKGAEKSERKTERRSGRLKFMNSRPEAVVATDGEAARSPLLTKPSHIAPLHSLIPRIPASLYRSSWSEESVEPMKVARARQRAKTRRGLGLGNL
jgi:hypothetical protein